MKEKAILPEKHIQEKREETGSKIREIREQRALSQEQLADLMGINRSTLSKIETGKFAITIDYLYRLGWHLDFDVAIIDKISE
jgi:DNA-binding XRE family transcriptional regulator